MEVQQTRPGRQAEFSDPTCGAHGESAENLPSDVDCVGWRVAQDKGTTAVANDLPLFAIAPVSRRTVVPIDKAPPAGARDMFWELEPGTDEPSGLIVRPARIGPRDGPCTVLNFANG